MAREADRGSRVDRRCADGEVLRGSRFDHSRRADRCDPQSDHLDDDRADALRFVLQEQGRAVAARLCDGFPALSGRHRRRDRHRSPYGRGNLAQADRERSVLRFGFQDRYGPVRRPSGVRPGLFGQARGRLVCAQQPFGQEGAYQPYLPDARQQAEPDGCNRCRRHLRRCRLQGYPHGRHALRRAAPDRARVDDVPRTGDRSGHRAEDPEGPRQARYRTGQARGGRPDVYRQDRRGQRPDRDQRYGRAALGDHRRPSAPRVRCRDQSGRSSGQLQGIAQVDRSAPRGVQETDRRSR